MLAKALVWVERPNEISEPSAAPYARAWDAACNEPYTIYERAGGHFALFWWRDNYRHLRNECSLDEAKQAAQRHADECVANMLSTKSLRVLHAEWSSAAAYIEGRIVAGKRDADTLQADVAGALATLDRILATRKEPAP